MTKSDAINKRFLSVGIRLKQLRGVTSQKDFSKKIGVPFRSYQRYEAGERLPKGHVLSKIAEKTFVTPEWVLTGEYQSIKEKESEDIRFLATGYSLMEEMIRVIARPTEHRLPLNYIAEILDIDPSNPLKRIGHSTAFYLAIMYLVKIFRESGLDDAKTKAILAQLEAFLPKENKPKIKRNLKK